MKTEQMLLSEFYSILDELAVVKNKTSNSNNNHSTKVRIKVEEEN